MAARSVNVTFTNKTDVALAFAGASLSHGEWTTTPPARIDAGQTVNWESESDGFATGTEGSAAYDVEGLGSASRSVFNWDDPFVGSNSYSESAPETFIANHFGGGGDNADVTWVFDDASTTGDGIPDDWKRNGVTIDPGDGSGPQFIDLPSMGADVNRPDIFVQADWMASPTHSHALSPGAIKTVVDAFANAPFVSRSGSIGINLHVDAGPASIMNFKTGKTWGSLSRARKLLEVPQFGTGTVDSTGNLKNYNWAAFDSIKNQLGGFTSSGRTKIFRYCISVHQLATALNSGISRALPGSDFIISLGTFTGVTDTVMAGTFMHELGHCLGLDHGGGDSTNYKPNYISVMNYLWQITGVTRGGLANIIDYSNAALNALNEGALNETVGLGAAAAGVATKHWVPASGAAPGAFVQVADASQPIDWDGDGLANNTNLALDTNNDGATGALAPFDDWKAIKLRGGAIGAGGAYEPPAESDLVDITPAELKLILPADTTPPFTSPLVWPPPNAAGWNRTDVQVTFTATDDISGVARTDFDLDGAGLMLVKGPVPIAAEGVHGIDYRSVDRSQNVEALKHLQVRIDKTAPEAVISYDPELDDIVVEGRDSLSGVDPGVVGLAQVMPTTWTDFGSDIAELRVYKLHDHAGNETLLAMKVRCSPQAWEASVITIRYSDQRGRARDAAGEPNGKEVALGPDRNTLIFGRVVGRNKQRAVLGVRQAVSIGEGGGRRTVRARYDVLDDYTLLSHESGSPSCRSKEKPSALEADIRGLVILHVATHNGRLLVEE
jgi:hypothetical protein